MAHIRWPNESIFDPFNIIEETYKHIGSHPVKAAILMPKDVESVIHPLLINIHGGLFGAGHSLFAPFWSPWALDLAVLNGSVVVSPDFRLSPSSNGISDIGEDLEDFWTWLNEKLPQVLSRRFRGHALDFSKIMLLGASSGGYGALQLALTHPQDITVLALMYPIIRVKNILSKSKIPKEPMGILRFPQDQLPSLQESLSWVVDRRRRVHTKDGFDPVFFTASLIDHEIFARTVLFPKDNYQPENDPYERIKAGASLPNNVWIAQGAHDTVVDVEHTIQLVELISQLSPKVKLRYDAVPSQDHFFDAEDEKWASFKAPALEFVENAWLDEQ